MPQRFTRSPAIATRRENFISAVRSELDRNLDPPEVYCQHVLQAGNLDPTQEVVNLGNHVLRDEPGVDEREDGDSVNRFQEDPRTYPRRHGG